MIKNQHDRFPFERVKDVCLIPGSGQNRPFSFLLPPIVQIEEYILKSGFSPHGEVAKAFLVVRLVTCELFMTIDAVVGIQLLATTLADKHMTTVLPTLCWISIVKGLKALSQTLQG